MTSAIESKPAQILITMQDYIMVCECLAATYGINVEQIPKEILHKELVLVSMIGLKNWMKKD